MTLLRHVYNKTEVGKMILIELHSLQLEAGSEYLLLTDTTTPLPYVTQCWLTEIRRFMKQFQIRLQFTENWNCHKSRMHDAFLMDIFKQCTNLSVSDLRNLNAVRLHLQVTTVADIATADGLCIHPQALKGKPITYRQSKWSWPRQPMVTKKQVALWTTILHRSLTISAGKDTTVNPHNSKLRQSLGEWVAPPNQTWLYYFDPKQDMLYHVNSPTHIECHMKSATIKGTRHYQIFDTKPEQSDIPVEEVIHPIPADVINLTDMQPNMLRVSVGKKPAKNSTKQVWDDIGSYRKALTPERQRLLAWSIPTFPYTTADIPKLISWLCKAPTMECGSDGSLKDKTGTLAMFYQSTATLFGKGQVRLMEIIRQQTQNGQSCMDTPDV